MSLELRMGQINNSAENAFYNAFFNTVDSATDNAVDNAVDAKFELFVLNSHVIPYRHQATVYSTRRWLK
jgi:hypothetical protein